MKVYLEKPISSEHREVLATWLANTINESRKYFEASKPNPQKDDFWNVDKGNDIKVKFFDDEPNMIEVIHRYQDTNAITGLSYWLAYGWNGEVIQ